MSRSKKNRQNNTPDRDIPENMEQDENIKDCIPSFAQASPVLERKKTRKRKSKDRDLPEMGKTWII